MSADDLPEGWTSATVGELLPPGGIFDGPFGSKLKTKDYTDSGVRVVRLENVGHLEFVADKETFVSEAKYDELERHAVGEGDVIFASFVDKEVRVCRLPEIGPAIAKADCFCLRPDESLIDPDLLVYFLASKQSHAAFAERVQGATRPRVNTKHVKVHWLGLPPLPEQRRIVARLDAIEAHRRAAREKLDRLPDLLDRYRQSVLAAAFRGDLTAAWREAHPDTEPASALLERIRAERRRRWIEDKAQKATTRAEARAAKKGQTWSEADRTIRFDKERAKATKKYTPPEPVDTADLPEIPEGWAWVRVDDLLPPDGAFDGPFGSKLKTADYTPEGVRVVRLENIGHLSFYDSKESFVSEEKYAELEKHTVGEGDIIFASFVEPEVRVCTLPEIGTAIAKADCFCLRPMEGVVDRDFLTYQLATDRVQRACSDKVHGATRPRVNLTQTRNLVICIPPLAEQAQVVAVVAEALARIESIHAAAETKSEDLDTLRQATLARAFRGELVPTDAALARAAGRPAPPSAALPGGGGGRGGEQGRGEGAIGTSA